jgi:hypothetical protein
VLSLFNGTPLTKMSDTTMEHDIWNTSVEYYFEFERNSPFDPDCYYSFNDVRLYINYDSEGYDLLNTARLQMNSLCVVGCQDCLDPGACSVCKTGYYLDSGNCYPCHYTCLTCSQAGKRDCTSCADYLQMMSDSSCQECPIGYAGQGGVCVRFQHAVFSL